jgi:hypothetical protein
VVVVTPFSSVVQTGYLSAESESPRDALGNRLDPAVYHNALRGSGTGGSHNLAQFLPIFLTHSRK